MMPKVSVVIPCYNQGHFLDEAVDSVLRQSLQDLEIIVVNDGSTDAMTITILNGYNRPKTRVITTDNQGLAAARNNGITEAQGEYILALDADDKIESSYLEKAATILDRNPDVGIVYCRARLFGQVETEWLLPDYSLKEMLLDNVIFCSALYRKKDWLEVGGYDTGMIYGWEDYDFWLSLIERGRKVTQIPELLFCYRVASDSMVRSKEKSQKIAMFKRIFQRHPMLFQQNIEIWIDKVLAAGEHYYTSRLYVDEGSGISDARSVTRKVDKDTFRLTFNVRQFSTIQNLRFDPVDTYAVVEIRRIVMKKSDDTEMEVSRLSGNEAYSVKGLLLFATVDPQCFFDLQPTHVHDLMEVQIDVCFHSLGTNALTYIVQFQQQMIRADQDTLAEMQRMGIAMAVRYALRRADDELHWPYIKRQLKSFVGFFRNP